MKSATLFLSALVMSLFMLAFAPVKTVESDTIANLAANTDDLSTLVMALEVAGLVETLNGEGPFTVFAPTNAAFDKLPEGTLESLLKPENKDQLTSILAYHVVSGKVESGSLENGMTATTVEGSDIQIMIGDDVKINDATVIQADIAASNGVVHLIDTVIMPPKKQTSADF
ncbi:MAG: fasciclin domain-containing protein [Balneolaceae bacterium]|nr:fasciclin domain-containing protein [Balneolaceae bacterium]